MRVRLQADVKYLSALCQCQQGEWHRYEKCGHGCYGMTSIGMIQMGVILHGMTGMDMSDMGKNGMGTSARIRVI